VETKTDLTLVLSSGGGDRAQDLASGFHPPRDGEIGESHTNGQPSESGFDAVGSALALMSKRDFLPFTAKFQ
jgi:hypothetical protein